MSSPKSASTALILGGTRGLGRAIALRCLANKDAEGKSDPITPIVVGRTATTAQQTPAFDGSLFVTADLSKVDEHARVFDFLDAAKVKPRYVFWTAGVFHRGPLINTSSVDVDRLTATHFTGPINFLREFHRSRVMSADKQPYRLAVVGSVLAYKTPHRPQAVFSALQAAKVGFARAFAHELSRDLPGSSCLVVNPWGMKTGFFANSDIKTDGLMDPAEVANIIFVSFGSLEINLLRAEDGSIEVRTGAQQPTL